VNKIKKKRVLKNRKVMKKATTLAVVLKSGVPPVMKTKVRIIMGISSRADFQILFSVENTVDFSISKIY